MRSLGQGTNTMKKLLIFASVAQAATGAALLAVPSLVAKLLLGTELTGIAATVARVAGIALISLGVACWPVAMIHRAFYGMLTYGTLVTFDLVYVGANGTAGILLWPAVVVHAVLSILLVRAWRSEQRLPETRT
jgi:hypothetical protein